MTISTKINSNKQDKPYDNININPNKSYPHFWNERSKNNHLTAFQELLGRLEKLLISNKELVTEMKPIKKEDIEVRNQVLKDIDYQLNIINSTRNHKLMIKTSLLQFIIVNATPGTSFTLHTICYTNIYGHHEQLTIPAYSNRKSDHLRWVIHHI